MNNNFYHISHGNTFDPTPITEDLKTFLHNTWTRGAEIIAFIGLLKFIVKNRYILTDKIDKKYFDSMYFIKPELEDKLRDWIEDEYEDAYIVSKTNNEENSLFNIINKITTSNKLGVSNSIASKFMHMATRKAGSGSTTTSTCFYYLPTNRGDGYYILYFTFDGKSIKECQILCFKGYDEKDEKSFYIRELEEWEDVDKKEYKK